MNGEQSFYVHLKHSSVKVKAGQKVKRGDVIALSGQTGFATYPYLHFGVRSKDGKSLRVIFRKTNFDYAVVPISPDGVPIFNKQRGQFF